MMIMMGKDNKDCQTEEQDDPNIVYKRYQRIDKLHGQKDLEKLEALRQAFEASENQLTFQRQQSAILSSAVRMW